MVIKRGDIFYADLRPVVGSEQGGDPSCSDHTERCGKPAQPNCDLRSHHIKNE